MSRVYTVQFAAVAVTATQDLFELVAAAGKALQLIGIDLSQTSDAGDAQDETLLLQFKRGQTTSGSGGTAPTPVPVDPSDAASGFTAEVNNTTKASAGTIVTPWSTGWNVRQTGIILLPDEFRFWIPGGGRGTLEIPAPADSLTMNGTLWVKEHG